MRERLLYIDQMRGLAILLVVMAHFIQTNMFGWSTNATFVAINSFHMPLFFFISGYIAHKTNKIDNLRQYSIFLLNKMRALLLPLFFWTLLIDKYFFSIKYETISWNEVFRTFTTPGLWFLLTLFEIFILYGLFNLCSRSWNKENILLKDVIYFVGIVILTLGGVFWNCPYFMSLTLYSIFFYVGIFTSKYIVLEKYMMNDKIFAIAFVLFCVTICHWTFGGDIIDDILKIIISISSFVIAMNVFRKYKQNTCLGNLLILLGKYSLAIYVSHWCMLSIVIHQQFAVPQINSFLLLAISLIVAIPICLICIVFAKIIEFSSILNLLFYGKKYYNKEYERKCSN